MRLTKVDVAKAHIESAVDLCFNAGNPASVYLLAASAREILTTLGGLKNKRTMLHGISETTGATLKDLIAAAHKHANFFKHAVKDPEAVLDDFDVSHADDVLMIACADYARVSDQHFPHAIVYARWWLAINTETVSELPLRSQDDVRWILQQFPGIKRMDRNNQITLGREMLARERVQT